MSWLEAPEEQEDPLIKNICPHCNAVDIKLDDSTLIKDIWSNESYEEHDETYLYSIYKCEYCNKEVNSYSLNCMYADDFADQVTDYLEEGWFVSKTRYNANWFEVEIAYDLVPEQPYAFPTIITIKLTKEGIIDWEQVNQDCIQVKNKFFNDQLGIYY